MSIEGIKSMSMEAVIRNGTIIDGTGKPRYKSSIGIHNGKIVKIGTDIGPGEREINAENRFIASGIIHPHSHSDAVLHKNLLLESSSVQGVTTLAVGNCGQSQFPIPDGENGEIVEEMIRACRGAENLDITWNSFEEYLQSLPDLGMNIMFLIGHGILRAYVMGKSKREATDKDINEMTALLTQCLEMGAYGMSTGLEYSPGIYSSEEELIALCRILKKHNAFYATHIRNENGDLWKSLKEAIRISKESGCPVHISHLKLAGINNWGETERLFELLERANDEGAQVTWDVYPYRSWGGSLKDLLPANVISNKNLAAILKDNQLKEKLMQKITQDMEFRGSSWNKVVIAHAPGSSEAIGRNIEEIATTENMNVLEVVFQILLENDGDVKIIVHDMNMDDVRILLNHPGTVYSTDSRALTFTGDLSKGSPHPRNYGGSVKILSFAREGLIPFEKAVRKMTSRPAEILGLSGRGIIKVGAIADLMIFDPETVRDNATYKDPVRPPTGIDCVLVNGQLVIKDGAPTGVCAGKIILSNK